ncbi:MAG: PhzF family phenazine biosynthesis protein [Propionibacteriaceae bacterium]
MASRPFSQVNVFSHHPYGGNPLAVVGSIANRAEHLSEHLSEDQMQAFAAWTNLSETTFLGRPTRAEADYAVRIFTPSVELPFAGHPTLGSAYVWLADGGTPRQAGVVVQECAAGLVRIRHTIQGNQCQLAFDAPPLRRYEPLSDADLDLVTAGLALDRADVLDASWLVNGPAWVGVRLATAAHVLAVQPDGSALDGWDVGVVGPQPPGADTAVEVRAFVGGKVLVEDPVTGSLQAGLARWLIDTAVLPGTYVAAQGTALRRQGRVHVEQDGARLWIGGEVSRPIVGTVEL